MKGIIPKILSTLILFFLTAIMPIIVHASNEGISLISTTNSKSKTEYIIYLKNYSNSKFKYAFSTELDPDEINLSYINSNSDISGKQVAFLDAEKYEALSKENSTIYMWVKDEKENLVLKGIQLDLKDVITKEDFEEIETLTNRINVEISTSKEMTNLTEPVRQEVIKEVKETSKAGYIKIKDSKDSDYYYQIIKLPSLTEYNKLIEQAENLKNEYNSMDMYEKVQMSKEFSKLYKQLIKENKWQKVENMEIKQPESLIQGKGMGSKYIVFLKKDDKNGNVTTDMQILQEYYDYEQKVEEEKNIIQETTKLPITYDSIALFIVLASIMIAMIVVFIKMRKLNRQNEEK